MLTLGILQQQKQPVAPIGATLSIDNEVIYFDYDGFVCLPFLDTISITASDGNAWTITDNMSWCSCSPTSGTGSDLITVFVNTSTTNRLGIITITSDAPTVTCGIVQYSSCPEM